MRVGRFDLPEGPRFGRIDGDTVHLLAGDPWDDGGLELTTGTVAFDHRLLLAPVVPSKVVAVGRNYLHHVQEMGYDVPTEPNLFLKPPSAIVGPGAAVVLPPSSLSDQVEHEAELAIIIGRRARNLQPSDALAHVFGFTCADDVSARDLQRRDASITRGKGFDTFCPLGPWIETELDLDRGVSVRCLVDGQLRQDGHTDELIFDVPTILAYVTQVMTLEPGDVVLTGSPGGSAALRPGDDVTIDIGGIGSLHHHVVATDGTAATG